MPQCIQTAALLERLRKAIAGTCEMLAMRPFAHRGLPWRTWSVKPNFKRPAERRTTDLGISTLAVATHRTCSRTASVCTMCAEQRVPRTRSCLPPAAADLGDRS